MSGTTSDPYGGTHWYETAGIPVIGEAQQWADVTGQTQVVHYHPPSDLCNNRCREVYPRE